jgi:pimeloyl-ACP methyl ester carboxylesterase
LSNNEAAGRVAPSTTATGYVVSGTAEIYYESRGNGPALLLISGAGGDAGFFSTAADALSDCFTVITYDRRGNSRSSRDETSTMSIAQEAEDAKALIDTCTDGKALVFGNSAGAIIALQLAATHPESAIAVIAHEPPIINLVRADHPAATFLRHVSQVGHRDGPAAGASTFLGDLRPGIDRDWPADLRGRFDKNLSYFIKNEYDSIIGFTPDIDALKNAPIPVVMAAGAENRGLDFASIPLANLIGSAWTELPGGHLSFLERPVQFADALRSLGTELISRVQGVAKEWSTVASSS